MPLQMERWARHDFAFRVDYENPIGKGADPTSFAVEFAVVSEGEPPPAESWVAGRWETTPAGVAEAILNVSGVDCPDTTGTMFTLEPGIYDIHLTPVRPGIERPARKVDTLEVR